MIAKGELGYIPAKHLVSALPEEGERPSSTHKKITVDGWDREDEEEVRPYISAPAGTIAPNLQDDAPDVHGSTAAVWQPEGHQGGVG